MQVRDKMTTVVDSQGGNGEVDRLSAYPPDIVDKPGEFRWIPKGCLRVDPSYQRQVGEYKPEVIAKKWSWVACGAINVAERQGIYYVYDGNHRLFAAMQRDDIKQLPCMVFRTRGVVDEAAGFIATNKYRRPITAVETFRALCITGDEVAVAIRDLLNRSHIEIRREAKTPGTVKCLSALMRCYKSNSVVFRAVWPLILESSRTTCVRQIVVESLFYIECRLRGTSDSLLSPPWRDRVVRLGSEGIINAASKAAAFYASTGVAVWAQGVVEALNRNVRKRLPIEFDRDKLGSR